MSGRRGLTIGRGTIPGNGPSQLASKEHVGPPGIVKDFINVKRMTSTEDQYREKRKETYPPRANMHDKDWPSIKSDNDHAKYSDTMDRKVKVIKDISREAVNNTNHPNQQANF
jgi:hypothetical protein